MARVLTMEKRMPADPISELERAVQELKRAVDEVESKQENHARREVAAVVSRTAG